MNPTLVPPPQVQDQEQAPQSAQEDNSPKRLQAQVVESKKIPNLVIRRQDKQEKIWTALRPFTRELKV